MGEIMLYLAPSAYGMV